ncbi:MAG: putative Rossmann fold flavoprotein [Planctomycetota bacterium]|jgi:predicted Rossmann fold flavoprotein
MIKTSKLIYDIVIIGGGAAGFFSAIQVAEKNPNLKIIILEKSPKVLEKVKISGGGRCNVTHACFEPKELVKFYPRGHKELLGPFHQFMTGDMMAWLADNGVETKIEADGRIFPASNSSQTIIDLFESLIRKYNIEVRTQVGVDNFYQEDYQWIIESKETQFNAKKIIIASGSSRKIWDILTKLGHQIAKPVPSLFTFKIQNDLIKDLPGLVVQNAFVNVKGAKLIENGPVLITHRGLSGPAILKLSAWEAVLLSEKNYQFTLEVNWIRQNYQELLKEFKRLRDENPKQKIATYNIYELPKRLWNKMIELSNLKMKKFAESSNKDLEKLASYLAKCSFEVNGKNTNKDEFVTCGGVELKEVNFKKMESTLHSNLFFAGEVINIDAVTGGFNFQNAWTTSFIAAQTVAE